MGSLFVCSKSVQTRKEIQLIAIINPADDGIFEYERGQKQYELSNHLGNVLSVISDQKLPELGSYSTIEFYYAEVVSFTDYYPFGSEMTERSWQNEYRYSFNGKERDTEGMGGGSSTYDYGFRIYNPALGKFLSLDPITKNYPMLSPFQFASNMPIIAIDLDGLEAKLAFIVTGSDFNSNATGLQQSGYEVLRFSTGEELLNHLTKHFANGGQPVESLVILSHGFESGIIGATNNDVGLYVTGYISKTAVARVDQILNNEFIGPVRPEDRQKMISNEIESMRKNGARSIADVKVLREDGIICGLENAVIILGGCNTGVSCDVQQFEAERNNPELNIEGNFASDLSVALEMPVIASSSVIRWGKIISGSTQPFPVGSNSTTKRQSSSGSWTGFSSDGGSYSLGKGSVIDLTTGDVTN